jgi:hypothetical protein
MDYYDTYSDNTIFLDILSDDFRINNLKLIKEMINYNYFNNNLIIEINNLILNQSKYLSDIYTWFKDTTIEMDNVNIIKNILEKNNIEIRDKILLQNLILPYQEELPKKSKIIFKKKKNNSFEDNVNELLNNYLITNDSNLIISFIESNCKEINEKNKICELLLYNYFQNKFICVLDLIEELILNQLLFKSNISKGLINIYNENSDIVESNIKLKIDLLAILKKLGITKNLEFLMETHNIEISV